MSSGRLEGQHAVITGGAGGIGYAIAERFAVEGASVVIADLSDNAVDVARQLSDKHGVNAEAYVGDLSLPGAGQQLVDQAIDALGSVEILVNNAGGGVITATENHTEATLRQTIDNNLWTTLRCSLAIIPYMVQRNYGRVVNIGAESVRNGLDGHSIYNAAKGGVHAVCVGWAREYARHGVTFNTVAASYTRTCELAAAEEAGSLSEEMRSVLARAVELIPMGRPAEVTEVAAAVLFLASEEASFITGQTLSVNGGGSMG